MRILEWLLLLANLPGVACCLVMRATPVWARVGPVVALLVGLAQLLTEGYRLQMIPAYLVTILLLLSCTWPRVPESGMWLGVVGVICVSGAGILGTLLPVFEFPEPTGHSFVGSTSRNLVDMTARKLTQDRRGDAVNS